MSTPLDTTWALTENAQRGVTVTLQATDWGSSPWLHLVSVSRVSIGPVESQHQSQF